MKVVILTGAGISSESGLKTFRDSDGLWAGYNIEEVCTPMALAADPQKVFDFYNMRRQEVMASQPNAGHHALVELEKHHEVTIITQNIDDLHERAGSSKVIHIHGEILLARSIDDFEVQVRIENDFHVGDVAYDGGQLRPHVCFFHETPYFWPEAQELAIEADIFVVIGTSLHVYPAAGLVDVTKAQTIYVIDPNPPQIQSRYANIKVIAEPATTGVPRLLSELTGTL
jgi:NAD-dependent deacetylase